MKRVIKVILVFLLMVSSVNANSVYEGASDDSNVKTINMGPKTLYIYDRSGYSYRDQNSYKVLNNIKNTICSLPGSYSLIRTNPYSYLYIYDDGAIYLEIDSCVD